MKQFKEREDSMGKISIYKNQVNESNINSALFLQYIQTYGFDPDNYLYILELFQSAKESISQFLKPYRQYLLSRKVKYDELEQLGIDGAYGYINEDGILVPKTHFNDDQFLYTPTKRLYTPHSYSCPTMDDFDVIIANGISPYMNNTANFSQDKYLGFCMDDTDKNLDISVKRYEKLVDLINKKSRDEYVLEHDRISSEGKELCLIRKSSSFNTFK